MTFRTLAPNPVLRVVHLVLLVFMKTCLSTAAFHFLPTNQLNDGSIGNRSGKWKEGIKSFKYAPDFDWVLKMSELTQDGTAEPYSRDQIPRRERG